jgi:TolB-like protein/Tfp pilus assembly protein PilF
VKRCPKCRRAYSDDSLNFCLDDGVELVYGPGDTDPETAILNSTPTSEADTRTFGSPSSAQPTDKITDPALQARSGRKTIVFAFFGVVILGILGVAVYRYLRPSPSKEINSIAVLPFTNASGSADAEYLSDGIADSLINSLSKIPGLNVKAESTVFRYRGQNVDPITIGKDLSVKAVLNGRVAQHGDDLSVYLSLVDTATGDQIWGEGYDRKLSDIVSLQKEITEDVSQKLQLRLSGADVQRAAKTYTNDPEAYQLYLRGRQRLLKTTQADIEAAIKYFQQAIDKDPTYALAYVGLADAYRAPVSERLPSEALSRSKAAVQKALELDDSLADAHAILGFIIFWYEWNWPAAEAEMKRAIELDPKNGDSHIFYAHLLSNLCRHDEALAEARRARELDPLNIRTNALEGQFLIHAGRVDEGIERLNAALELEPNSWMAHLFLTSGYIEKGMLDKAIDEGAKTIEIHPHTRSFSFLAYALAKAGKTKEARDELNKVFAEGNEHWVSSYSIAMIYNGLGETDEVFKWLEKGVTDRDPRMVFLKVEPKWNNLRPDPRFQKIMTTMGF